MGKKILSVDDLKDAELSRIFFMARSKSHWKRRKDEDNAVLLTAFFEPSTRTRLSFSFAALNLGFKVLDFDPENSSLKKGESFVETLNTIACLQPSILVTRTSARLDRNVLENLPLALINGGDGCNEHPSQALLDCFTLLNAFRCDDLFNKRILIIGDIAHSRVAGSNIKLMKRLGAHLSLLAPLCFLPTDLDPDIEIFSDFSQMPKSFDAVMALRIQKERIENDLNLCDSEYFNQFGLNKERLLALGSKCLILHPGPMNLGVEIEHSVASDPRSLINEQVKNGVLIRTALIDYCTAT